MSDLAKLTIKASRVTGLTRRTIYRWAENGVDIRNEIEKSCQDKWLKASEVASLLNISKSSVYRYIDTGVLKAIRFGSTIRISSDSVCKIVENFE